VGKILLKDLIELARTQTEFHELIKNSNTLAEKVISSQQIIEKASFSIGKQVNDLIQTVYKNFESIRLPKISIPKINFDYERIEKSINQSAGFGWTLTANTPFKPYLDSYKLEKTLDKYDQYFYELYSANSYAYFKSEKEYILENINHKNKKLLEQCFENFEKDNYEITIPALISAIEGQIAELLSSPKYGFRLLKEWENKIPNEEKNLSIIIEYSMVQFLKNSLFTSNDFNSERLEILNRNWVMHGRDNPELWKKTDALKLFINLSTLLFINEKNRMAQDQRVVIIGGKSNE